MLWILYTSNLNEEGRNEKCEYCFQARLMQASNVERGNFIEHLALLDENLKNLLTFREISTFISLFVFLGTP